MKTLVIDVGGNHVKLLVEGAGEARRFASGPSLTPQRLVSGVDELCADWSFERITIGYPGLVAHGKIVAEPKNLGSGWVGFDFAAALGHPVRLVNDAAMQALGRYEGGRMLFLGLGTGLGSAMIVDGRIEPMELAHLPYRKGRTYEDYVGDAGRRRLGHAKWRKHVEAVIELLRTALEPDYVVVGGGNAERLRRLPAGVRLGHNADAFEGGARLWARGDAAEPTPSRSPRSPLVVPRDFALGVIGLGRMGANIVRRLMRADIRCAVFDLEPEAVETLVKEGATGAASLDELVEALATPRAIWLMVPAAAVDATIDDLAPRLELGDIIIDGGNSYYVDDIRRARALAAKGLHYVDVGTSGGVWGLERGYCQMIGGAPEPVRWLDPVFATLAPPRDSVPRTPGREGERGTAEHGYLHCGGPGAGHFVKMVHNGIEYGAMAAYAEGLSVLRHADVGKRSRSSDAETAPLRDVELYQYELDVGEIAELWRRGSVVASWLLDLTARALLEPELEGFAGRVSDSGEGRWTVKAAIDEGVPLPVISAALFQRFSSRGAADYADKLLSAMRGAFGGHHEKAAPESGG